MNTVDPNSPYDSTGSRAFSGSDDLDVSEANETASAARPGSPLKHFVRAFIALVIGAGLYWWLLSVGENWDYQYGFLGATVIGLLTSFIVVYQLHRAARQMGYGWQVPVAAVLCLAGCFALVRFKHFSGEMVPQFEWRFSQTATLPLVTEITEDSGQLGGGAVDAAGNQAGVAAADSENATSPDSDTSSDSFVQFLGNDRNGVIPVREFAVPKSAGDLKELWRQGIGGGWSSFAVADGRAITMEQREDKECVTAYRLSDGALLWIQTNPASHFNALGGGGPRCTPLIHGGRVYTQGATGFVQCLDAASGKPAWQADLLALGGWTQEESEAAITWGRSASPLLAGGNIVLPFGALTTATGIAENGRSLIAFDAESGDVVWTAGDDQISYASANLVRVDGKDQIVSVNESSVSGHAIQDGGQLWSMDWPGQSNAAASCSSVAAVGSNRFIVSKGYFGGSSLCEVQATGAGEFSLEELWHSARILRTKFNHACIDGDVAYSLSNGRLEAAAITSGDSLWLQPHRKRYQQGQVLLVEDTLVVQAESGAIGFVEATPSKFNELLSVDALTSKTWNIPTVVGRFLLTRNDREAVCYQLPAAKDAQE